jgi:hypothetical protein
MRERVLGGKHDQMDSNAGGCYVSDQSAAADFWTNKVEFQIVSTQSRLVLYPESLMNDWNERKPSIVFECEDVDRTAMVL